MRINQKSDRLLPVLWVTLVLLVSIFCNGVEGVNTPRDSADGGSICIAGNRIFLAWNQDILVLDLDTGRLVKTFPQPDSIVLGPILTGGSLVFSQGGAHTSLAAINPITGTMKWTADHRIFNLAHDRGLIFVDDQINDSVHAFAAGNGKRLWISKQCRTDHTGAGQIIITTDGRLFTSVAVLDRKSGTVLHQWREVVIEAGDVGPGGVWLADDQGDLFLVNEDNKIVWKLRFDDCYEFTQVMAWRRYVLVARTLKTENTQRITILDPRTRRILWERDERDNRGGMCFCDIAGTDDVVVLSRCNDRFRSLIAFSAVDGKELWRYQSKSWMISPVISNEVVYIEIQGGLAAINLKDGSERWVFRVGR
jgi:outer membrane protein assembly factor BamB